MLYRASCFKKKSVATTRGKLDPSSLDYNFFVHKVIYIHVNIYMIKKTFTINEKKKDFGLLKKVRKQERLSLETRHEHSISVQSMNIRFQCLILHP